ncbi:branched-chain amino acid ABC transporter permease [Patulibacter sp. SYSU D01012]|uniref:branched-chain amino acid ABC transporter permease n=1 Tax=Patulibacter sp. SYSU D01012 TaxID=2817381 RepID=UPI001B30D7D7|nr:branched-chain amino acid ABC transporter permease [Patulibacter sp. SYSU D01012]
MVLLRTHAEAAVLLVIAFLVAVVVPLSGADYWIYLLTIVALFAIAVVGLNVLTGYAGQVSFATTAFMAVGGYTVALTQRDWGTDPWVALVVAVGLGSAAAVLLGLPLLRLRGHYLAMATFTLALGVFFLAGGATGFTGGATGVPGVARPHIAGLRFDEPLAFYALAWVILGLAVLGVMALARSRTGRAWRALATHDRVATSVGIPVTRYKLLAFVIASALASLSGALYVQFTTFVSPDLYDNAAVLQVFTMLFVGGLAVSYGPIIGAAVVIVVPNVIGGLESYETLVFNVALLVILVLRPQGLVGKADVATSVRDVLPRWLRRRVGTGAVAPTASAEQGVTR